VVGYALGSRPSSIKNYRDEFDPIFPNARKGWHKREIHQPSKKVLDEYGKLDFASFSGLIQVLRRLRREHLERNSNQDDGEERTSRIRKEADHGARSGAIL